MEKRLLYRLTTIILIIMVLVNIVNKEAFAFSSELNSRLDGAVILFLDSPKAFVGNVETQIDSNNINVCPLIQNGRTIVPVRFIAEKFGATVSIDDSDVTIIYGNKNIELSIGSGEMVVNGQKSFLEVPAQLINDRTYIPLRAITEAMGKKLFWDDRGLIIISGKGYILNPNVDMHLINQIIKKFELRGNTIGNSSNYGSVAQQGDWVYYDTRMSGLYRSRIDGSDPQRICDESASDINVIGNWLYCSLYYYKEGRFVSTGIYKISVDGRQKIKLIDGRAESMNVVGDWIYYVDNATTIPYKMKTDGTCKTQICNLNIECLTVDGDWIYFQNGWDKSKLYKMRLDGTQIQKVCDGFAYKLDINIESDWIYFVADYPMTGLYKIKKDGSNLIKLSNKLITYPNVLDDMIYCGFYPDGLYKMNTDGSNATKITDGHISTIYTVGDWIYYGIYQNGLYKIKMDGSSKQLVVSYAEK